MKNDADDDSFKGFADSDEENAGDEELMVTDLMQKANAIVREDSVRSNLMLNPILSPMPRDYFFHRLHLWTQTLCVLYAYENDELFRQSTRQYTQHICKPRTAMFLVETNLMRLLTISRSRLKPGTTLYCSRRFQV